MLLDGRDEARWETAAMGQISDEPDRYQPKLLVLLCAQPDHAGYLGRLPESGQSIPAPSRLGWVDLRRPASGGADPKSAVRLVAWCGRHRTGCFGRSKCRSGHSRRHSIVAAFEPTSVIGRLRSHSGKQTFAVLLRRQDCALVGRSTEVRLCSKADVRPGEVIDHHGPRAVIQCQTPNALI